MAEKAKQLVKKVIGYPEHPIPSISSKDYLKRYTKDPRRPFLDYLLSLFPITHWITRYNFGWLSQDVIAGLTIGIIVVPQGMSYALLANLPVEYGLYTSFVGVLIYCFFATSKDVTIGPVAVMSIIIGQIILHIESAHGKRWPRPEIATTLSFICGFITLGIGLLRIGWIVEFIPLPAVSGFMTGSAINIAAGQVPTLMGITGFDTRAATYKVIINTLKGLPRTKRDAAFGLFGLFSLYLIRYVCDRLGRRYPRRARLFFFLSIFRIAFVMIILTIGAWLYAKPRKTKAGKFPIKILQNVPRGLKHVHAPTIDVNLLHALGPHLPLATIVLLLEHIAIAKSFGRLNNYKINPNQELIAIGVTNTVGSCFGAYAATGSFSRTALKSKCGVRTPAAGIVTGIVVLIAIYGLTDAFYWIPNAGLAAVIIHAVADLVASPAHVYSFWRVSPLEFFIWLAAVLVTVFSSIENGIYTSVGASMLLLVLRIAHPRRNFLGRVTVHTDRASTNATRDVFLPLKDDGLTNPNVRVTPPSPGVIVYRLDESYIYPNASWTDLELVDYVKDNFRRGGNMTDVKNSERPWNDPGPARGVDVAELVAENERKPDLRAVVLDFSGVSQIDTTGVQSLLDARSVVERWANHTVEFHFAGITSPWIRRALIAGGFGYGDSLSGLPVEVVSVVPYRGEKSRGDSADDPESLAAGYNSGPSVGVSATELPALSTDTPFFHIDLAAAVRAAERASSSKSLDDDVKS